MISIGKELVWNVLSIFLFPWIAASPLLLSFPSVFAAVSACILMLIITPLGNLLNKIQVLSSLVRIRNHLFLRASDIFTD